MKDYTKLFYDALALDSIYRLLTWDDRIDIQLSIIKGQTLTLNNRMIRVFQFLEKTAWIAPQTKYDENRMLKFYNEKTEEWMFIEKYPENNEKITNLINEI